MFNLFEKTDNKCIISVSLCIKIIETRSRYFIHHERSKFQICLGYRDVGPKGARDYTKIEFYISVYCPYFVVYLTEYL